MSGNDFSKIVWASTLVVIVTLIFYSYYVKESLDEGTKKRQCVLFSESEISCISPKLRVRLENKVCENEGQSIVWLVDESGNSAPVSALIGIFPARISDVRPEASKIEIQCVGDDSVKIAIPASLELKSSPGIVAGVKVIYEKR